MFSMMRWGEYVTWNIWLQIICLGCKIGVFGMIGVVGMIVMIVMIGMIGMICMIVMIGTYKVWDNIFVVEPDSWNWEAPASPQRWGMALEEDLSWTKIVFSIGRQHLICLK